MADKSTMENAAKAQETPKTQETRETQDTFRTRETPRDDGQDNAAKKGSEDKSPLDERVEQIDKNEAYEDVIGRHKPGDRYPGQRR